MLTPGTHIERERKAKEQLGRIRHTIAVHSGKGGVGKTTVAVNLAATLAGNHRTGLLDADIDCPDIPRLLGMNFRMQLEGGKLLAAAKHGMRIMSSAFLHDADKPIIMRAAMKHHALMQMIEMTDFGNIEYLIIDLPAGMSDVQLAVMQLLGVSSLIFVTTSQHIAVQDTRKSIVMAKMVGAPIAGVVENMAGDVFGSGGGEALAAEEDVPFLGRILLDKAVREAGDEGVPAVLQNEHLAAQFKEIIARMRL